ncbi:hypothetical protein [Natrarchaeobius chitinivorans]|uniref:DUF4129 domain-containing protein n=1 Tax=Natrarchaeobius chitinivorans TaxID=1679083 RepID=A0A3N6LYS9_NATCH|nr:hypothetical protein [Natrarchaeobius chitinivorans]RQG96013.1 hypothetical protein EA473_07510 [Natrarchaeobius chitinivorans]
MNDVVVRCITVVLVVSFVLLAGVTGAVPAVSTSSTEGLVLAQADNSSENVTPRHQNPDEYSSAGDDDELAKWLTEHLDNRLGDSSVALEEGEYEMASEYLDDEYYERVEQYVEITGDTDGIDDIATEDEPDSETRSAYLTAAEEQDTLTSLVGQYNETKSEYETARDGSEPERAHDLARELESLTGEIEETSTRAIEQYEFLTEETGSDYTDTIDSIDNTKAAIQEEQAGVRSEQFVDTELVLDPATERASFENPLRVRGEIRAADDSTPSYDGLNITVEDHPVPVQTYENGTFTFEYRPTVEPVAADSLSVQYTPAIETRYVGTETSIPISLEQTELDVAITEQTSTAAYNETLSVSGTATAANQSVDELPVTVRLGGEPVGTTTVENGSFSKQIAVPATVPDGDQPVSVSFEPTDRALSTATANGSVTIEETATELDLEAEWTNQSDIRIDGRLVTTDGVGIEGQSIDLEIDGITGETVSTDEDGAIATTVSPSDPTQSVTVSGTYDGSDTNLDHARDEATVAPAGTDEDGVEFPSTPVLVGLGGTVFALAVGLVWWIRRRKPDETDERGDRFRDPAVSSPADSTAVAQTRVNSTLERATDQLTDDRTDAAVRNCYTAVRDAQQSILETDHVSALTHWEFYHRYRANVDDATSLQTVMEAYERAAFTTDSVSRQEAKAVLEAAHRLCFPESVSFEDDSEPAATTDD